MALHRGSGVHGTGKVFQLPCVCKHSQTWDLYQEFSYLHMYKHMDAISATRLSCLWRNTYLVVAMRILCMCFNTHVWSLPWDHHVCMLYTYCSLFWNINMSVNTWFLPWHHPAYVWTHTYICFASENFLSEASIAHMYFLLIVLVDRVRDVDKSIYLTILR